MQIINDLLCIALHRWEKTIRIMKLTAGLILFAMITASAANTYSQTVRLNLNLKDATIVDIFREIERNSEFGFFFKSEEFNLEKRQSVKISNATIDEVLKKILDENYSYKILDKNIVITKGSLEVTQQHGKKISGKVTDPNGVSLPGVTVLVKGTTTGVITDSDGYYSLNNIADNATLQFSFVGLKSQEVGVGNQAIINVIMEDETFGLDEVIVVGYGTQKKSDITGSIQRVDAIKYENRAMTNLVEMLSGTVAGLSSNQDIWASGGGSMEIRGINSLKAGTGPLLVVDGVIYNGNISDINPHDIKTMDILKDASSAAVYGAKSASGVICITTKQGQKGKPTLTFNSSVGTTGFTKLMYPRSPEDYLQIKTDYFEENGSRPKNYFTDPNKLPSDISTDQWLKLDPSPGVDPIEVWFTRLGMYPSELENYKAGENR